MNIKKQLVNNTMIIFIGKSLPQILSFLLLPLYTSMISAEDYGYVDIIFTVGSLLMPLITLQLDSGLFRALIEHRGDRVTCQQIARNILIVAFMLFAGFDILYCSITRLFSIKYNGYVLLYINAYSFIGLVLGYFRGIGKDGIYAVLSSINGLLIIIFNIYFVAVMNLGGKGMLMAYALGMSCASLSGLLVILYQGRGIRIKIQLYKVKDILSYSVFLVFDSVSKWIVNLSDRFIISLFLSYSYNGIYAVSNKFPYVFMQIYNVFNLAWTEMISVQYDQEGITDEIKQINHNIGIALLYLSALVIAGMFVIFPIFVDDAYADGLYYIPILIIAMYFNCKGAQLGGILIAQKKSRAIALTTMIGAFVNVIINIALIKELKLYAAAFSTLIAYLLMYALRKYVLRNTMNDNSYKDYVLPLSITVSSIVVYYLQSNILKLINLLLVSVIIAYQYRIILLNYFKRFVQRDSRK